jgi:predicted HicB family RNase H-like nuclease
MTRLKDPENAWSLRYRDDMRETLQIRLSKQQKLTLNSEAKDRGISTNELIRQYADYLMNYEETNG